MTIDKPGRGEVTNRDPYLQLLKLCLTAAIYPESSWQIVTGLRPGKQRLSTRLRRALLSLLARKDLMLVRRRQFDPAARARGEDWPCFGYSMAGIARMDNVQFCIERILRERIPGDLIETGVWRGGMAIFMRAVLMHHGDSERTVWAADSFEGLPKPRDTHDRRSVFDLSDWDTLKVGLDEVRSNFERFGLLDERVRFIPGWFKNTLQEAPIHQLALLRLDGDMYESTMDALSALYSKVSTGGFIVVDDYHSWPACQEAVDDYRLRNDIDEPLVAVDRQAVYWRKR
jgi:hypothetical protein